jgi:Rho GDP-dissociation inhibitor
MADHHDDLHAEQTEGFKVGEKKTIDEYQKLGMFPSPPNNLA